MLLCWLPKWAFLSALLFCSDSPEQSAVKQFLDEIREIRVESERVAFARRFFATLKTAEQKAAATQALMDPREHSYYIALGGLVPDSLIDELTRQLLLDKDARVLALAAKAAAWNGSAKFNAELLRELTKHTDQTTAEWAVIALGIAKDRDSLPAIKACLTHAAPKVRAAAALSIGKCARPEDKTTADVAALLQDADPNVRLSAAGALLVSDAEIPRVLALLDDPDADLRTLLVMNLASYPTADTAQAVAARLADEHGPVRKAAVYALGRMKARAHTGALKKLLADDDAEIRQAATWALGELKDE